MSTETPIGELTDAILALKRVEIEGATIEDFRSTMVEMRTALIHFRGGLIAENLAQAQNSDPVIADLFDSVKRAIELCNSFSLVRDEGLDSKTLATLYYTLANISGFESLIDALSRLRLKRSLPSEAPK